MHAENSSTSRPKCPQPFSSKLHYVFSLSLIVACFAFRPADGSKPLPSFRAAEIVSHSTLSSACHQWSVINDLKRLNDWKSFESKCNYMSYCGTTAVISHNLNLNEATVEPQKHNGPWKAIYLDLWYCCVFAEWNWSRPHFLAELSKWSFHKIQSRIKNSPFNITVYLQWSNKHLGAKNDVTVFL